MDVKVTTQITFRGDIIFTSYSANTDEAFRLIQLFQKKFPERDGWHMNVAVEVTERQFYSTANSFLREIAEQRGRVSKRE